MKREVPQPPSTFQASPPPFGLPLISEAERTPAILIHVSPLLGLLVPALGGLLGPLLAWLVFRDRSAALDEQGKEALNFQISVWIYGTLGVVLLTLLGFMGLFGGAMGEAAGSGALAGFGFLSGMGLIVLAAFIALVFWILPIITMILAVMSVSEGRPYHYPLMLRLLK